MGLINNGNKVMGATSSVGFEYTYPLSYSAKFSADLSANLYWTVGAQDSATKWTVSTWIKRTRDSLSDPILTGWEDSTTYAQLSIGVNDNAYILTRHSGTIDGITRSLSLHRDPTQWFHFMFIYDTTEASGTDRSKFYINGVFVAHDGSDALNSGTGCRINQETNANYWGRDRKEPAYGDFYLADTHLLDGIVTATPSDFGEFINGTWVPKEYTGGHGSMGYHMNYADSGDLGKDVSGNANHLTNSNVTQSLDTPTNSHPILDISHDLSTATIGGGGLTCTGTENEYATTAVPPTGKWGWEITVAENGSFGLEDVEGNEEVAADVSGEVVEMLVDMDNGTLKKKVDGGSLETIEASLDTTATWLPHFKAACAVDFGADSYTPSEAGYSTLCATNYPQKGISIYDSELGLWVNTREGTGAVANVTGASFDTSVKSLAWIKNRDAIDEHKLVDTVRGATKELSSDSSGAEGTNANGLTAFLTNGFSLGTGANGYNDSAESFVDWVFNMLPKYGMDIVTYTGTGAPQTIAHSLGVVPDMIITKSYDAVHNWAVYHSGTATDPETDYLLLDVNAVVVDSASTWNDTAPTSSVFTVNTSAATNTLNDNYVGYLFANVEGFLKCGYYIGNASADGPRIHTGFRPRYVLIKDINGAYDWHIFDSERTYYNQIDGFLETNSTNAEATGTQEIDFLANGFKIRNPDNGTNATTNRHVYLAIGDAFPYVNAF